MFFLYVLLTLIVLTGYAFFRLKSLLDTKRQKILFTVAYWFVVVSFAGVEMLSHSAAPAWADWLLIPGYLSLPYLLYLFLLVLAYDIFRGANVILHLLPRERLKARKARLMAVSFLLSTPVIIVLIGHVRNSELRVNEYQIDIPRKTSEPRHWSIAVASDFHLGTVTSPSMMPRFAEKINALNADLLLLPGDLLEGDRDNIKVDEFAREFRSIRTRYGVYGSLGNHESYGRHGPGGQQNTPAFFQRAGITVLRDSAALIGGSLWLVGRNDNRSQGRKPMSDLMQAVGDSLPVLVLDHKPVDLENIRAAGADVVVSGHTHHGQLWPLNYITRSIYDVSWGYKQLGSLHAFVTSGVQVWGPPVRTAGNSEIMLLDVAVK